jgi:hypothetical protein
MVLTGFPDKINLKTRRNLLMNVISKALAVRERAEDKFYDFCVCLAVKATRILNYSGECVHTAFKPKLVKMLTVMPVIFSMFAVVAFAAEGDSAASGTADGAIEQIIGLLQTWIPRLGGMVAVVGAIQLGLGFKDEDSNGKTRGMQTMIGGAIVAALATIIDF